MNTSVHVSEIRLITDYNEDKTNNLFIPMPGCIRDHIFFEYRNYSYLFNFDAYEITRTVDYPSSIYDITPADLIRYISQRRTAWVPQHEWEDYDLKEFVSIMTELTLKEAA